MELCFGCGQDNPEGLHLTFQERPEGSVLAEVNLGPYLSGEPGIVHGGIQATILDEVMGRAVQRRVRELVGHPRTAVTAAFELRYRVGCPTGAPLRAEGTIRQVAWPSIHVDGWIVDADGTLLTEATARWRVLVADPVPGAT